MKKMASLSMATLALSFLLAGCGTKNDAAPAPQPIEPVAAPAPSEAPAPAAQAVLPPMEDPAKLLAKVNGTDITEGDLQKVLNQFMQQMGGRIPPEKLAEALPRVRERIVEELIMRRIMLDEIAKQGITLSDEEFAEIKTELSAELPPGTTLESYMAETGVSEAEMREQMAVRKMIMAKADAIEKPSDDEIKAFYDENQDGFSKDASVTASHILIKLDADASETDKAAKRERIEALRKQLNEGADFAELAKANSDCPSASSGGDLGSFGKGQMVPEFEDAAFSQPIGSVGEVVETQFGFHLIKVTEKSEAQTQSFDEVKDRIADILSSQKQQDVVRQFVDGLRAKADVQRFDAPAAEETLLQIEEAGDEVLTDEAPESVEVVEEVVETEAVAVEEAVAAPETVEVVEEVVSEEVVQESVEIVSEPVAVPPMPEVAPETAAPVVEEAPAVEEPVAEASPVEEAAPEAAKE